jgi:hypothetical protein
MHYAYFIFRIERDDKYKNVQHQNDVWHGGKNITKKINAVSLYSRVYYSVQKGIFKACI